MKRFLSALIVFTMLLTVLSFGSIAVGANDASQTITVTLDEKILEFDQNPIIVNSRTMVPLRVIFEALGASVEWTQETQTVTSVKGNTTISMTIGNAEMVKNDTIIVLDVAPQIVGDRTLVPVRAVAESFNCDVDWDGETRTVIIKSKTTLGNKLLASFEATATDSADALSIAETLIKNEAINFAGGAMPVEEGYLVGFDNTEIKGFKDGAMFAPMIGTIPFVGYVFSLKDGADIVSFTEILKNSANLRWNICTSAEEMVVASKGNKVFFIMCPEGLESPEEDARKTAEAFMESIANLEFNKLEELVVNPDNIPAELKELDTDALVSAELDVLTAEYPDYAEVFREIYGTVIEKAKSEIKYEIKDISETDGAYVFFGTLTAPVLDTLDIESAMEENFNEEVVSALVLKMILEGRITETTTEKEVEALLMPLIIDILKESIKKIDFSTAEVNKLEFNILVVKVGDKWLVDDENSTIEND